MLNKGVSDHWRGALWMKLLGIEQAIEVHSDDLYQKLLSFENREAEKQIEKDVERTMSELGLWREDHQGGNNKMFNVLKAYANYDNEVGYVQGINYLAGILLFYISDEEKVFWSLLQLMQWRNWRTVYTQDFPKMREMTQFLQHRLEQDNPAVLAHLNNNCLVVEGTFSPHFMTLFIYLAPIEISTRLFEVFILDGDLAMVRLILRMIDLKQSEILKRQDVHLQRYVLKEMIVECVEQYSTAYLLDFEIYD